MKWALKEMIWIWVLVLIFYGSMVWTDGRIVALRSKPVTVQANPSTVITVDRGVSLDTPLPKTALAEMSGGKAKAVVFGIVWGFLFTMIGSLMPGEKGRRLAGIGLFVLIVTVFLVFL